VDDLTIALRLAAALVAGVALGVDRDLRHKPAGVRTHALVSIGSALVVLAALIGGGTPESLSRVLQGLITGIGFLGAGVIIHHEKERRIEGLTTAASIWVAAGLGAACGAGLLTLVGFAIVAAMIVLVAGGPFERVLERMFVKAEKKRSPNNDAAAERDKPGT
jgi:putative Mg2+ transporter-C (MgtC) family protein